MACASLSSSNIAFDSPSISTGSGGGTAFRGKGKVEDRGVVMGETASEAANPRGGRPGEVIGDGAADTFADGAVDPWKRNTLAKSVILDRFEVSDFDVVVLVRAGILSM